MADKLTITLAQLNQTVGDLAGNAAAMLAVRDKARHADLIVFPEMQLIGYPPEDLIQKPALIERAAAELEKLARVTADGGPAMLVGSVFVRDGYTYRMGTKTRTARTSRIAALAARGRPRTNR